MNYLFSYLTQSPSKTFLFNTQCLSVDREKNLLSEFYNSIDVLNLFIQEFSSLVNL